LVNLFSSALKIFRRAAYSKRGQFLLPSVLLVPIVLLVIYLIYETAKLSREKIRQQFALDAAAFVELQPAATYLNASAYVNAAFPYRVFRDNMTTKLTFTNPKGNAKQEELSVYDFFYRSGAFPGPADPKAPGSWNPKDTDLTWKLQYAKDTRKGWEVENPKSVGDDPITLGSPEVAEAYQVDDTLFFDGLWFYITVYNLFGDIFTKQGDIYDKISAGGMFFKKSYYLNTGTCNESECGREGAAAFSNLKIKLSPFYIKNAKLWWSEFFYAGGKQYQQGNKSTTMTVKKMGIPSGQLFQFSFLDSSSRSTLRRLKGGIDVTQPFRAPDNWFNVDLQSYNPHVHATVFLECPADSNNCVWPQATSKYQVILEP